MYWRMYAGNNCTNYARLRRVDRVRRAGRRPTCSATPASGPRQRGRARRPGQRRAGRRRGRGVGRRRAGHGRGRPRRRGRAGRARRQLHRHLPAGHRVRPERLRLDPHQRRRPGQPVAGVAQPLHPLRRHRRQRAAPAARGGEPGQRPAPRSATTTRRDSSYRLQPAPGQAAAADHRAPRLGGRRPAGGRLDRFGHRQHRVVHPGPAAGSSCATRSAAARPPGRSPFGPPGMVPLAGNWDGRAGTSVGYYDPATGTFHLRNALQRRAGRRHVRVRAAAHDPAGRRLGPARVTPGVGYYDPADGAGSTCARRCAAGPATASFHVRARRAWSRWPAAWSGAKSAGVGVLQPGRRLVPPARPPVGGPGQPAVQVRPRRHGAAGRRAGATA